MNYNKITTIFFIAGIIVMSSLYTAIPLTAEFAKDFKIPQSIATLNGVAFSVTYSVSCLFYGTISEKYGRIRTILFGICGLVMICMVMGFTFFRDTGRFKSDTRYICCCLFTSIYHIRDRNLFTGQTYDCD